MNRTKAFSMWTAILLTTAYIAAAEDAGNQVALTMSNAADSNQILVYDSDGHLLQTVQTQAKGGASGNAGGIAASEELVAAVNYGSQSVTVLRHGYSGFTVSQAIHTLSNPLSVAFGHNHLYVLGTTTVESHPVSSSHVSSAADGSAKLLVADGSAAQVGVLPSELIVSEKSSMIETFALSDYGAIDGTATEVKNLPSPANAPFGLITRGNDAYVTIAHSDEISLVRNDSVLTVTPSGTQHAPCWLALEGPFLFSSNSPSLSISRYAVYGRQIVQDAAIAAKLAGSPTDIAVSHRVLAVIDGSGRLSIFNVDEDGNLTLKAASSIPTSANGVALVRSESDDR